MSRRPVTLRAQAEELANQTHSRRLAELQAMDPLLQHLEALCPQLQAAGVQLYAENLSLMHLTVAGVRRKVLRVPSYFSSGPNSQMALWVKALLAHGFAPVRCDEPGRPYPTAVLRRGPLLVCVDVTEADATDLCRRLAAGQKEAA